MQGTWRAFCQDMAGAVQSRARSRPLAARDRLCASASCVHNYFRTRGVTLTSYELRRLVAELLACGTARPSRPTALVSFAGEPADGPWAGRRAAACSRARVPEAAFEAPPSPLVSVRPPDAARVRPRCWRACSSWCQAG